MNYDEQDKDDPAFSQELHDRIMSRIAQSAKSNSDVSPVSSPAYSSVLLRAASIAIAAMVVLGIYVTTHLLEPSVAPSPHQSVASTPPSVPIIQNPIQALELPIVSQSATADYTDVDHDGQELLGYFARQLDLLPKSKIGVTRKS
jgi:hypothetical protein